MKENTNPLLWYVCKFCRRAFQQPHDLVRHKKANHLDRILADAEVKKLEKNNGSRAFALDKSDNAEEQNESTEDVGGDTGGAENVGGDLEGAEDPGRNIENNMEVEEQIYRIDTAEDIIENMAEGSDSENSSVTAEDEPSLSGPSASSASENNAESENEDRRSADEKPKTSESSNSSSHEDDENSGQVDSDHTSSSIDEFQTYKCQTCSKICASERALRIHITFMHTKDYLCDYCCMSFNHPRFRSYHIAKVHADELCESTSFTRVLGKRVVKKTLDYSAKDIKRPRILGRQDTDSEMNGSLQKSCDDSSSTAAARKRKTAAVSKKHGPTPDASPATYYCHACNKWFQSETQYQLHQDYHKRNDKEESVTDLDETLPIEFARIKKSNRRSRKTVR